MTDDGNLINKIGTSQIALIAQHHGIPFYSAATLWKFDYSTQFLPVEIEHRDPSEIWDLEGIEILNPAFDITNREYIDLFITEQGIQTPESFVNIARAQIPKPNQIKIVSDVEKKPSNEAIITSNIDEANKARLKGYYVFSDNFDAVADIYFDDVHELDLLSKMRILW